MPMRHLAEHEVLHTAGLMMEFWENHIAGHHVVHGDPELRTEAAKVAQSIAEFHQFCSQLLPMRRAARGPSPFDPVPDASL